MNEAAALLIPCPDFLPGTCPFDIFPVLLQLPFWLQPWRMLGERLTKPEAVLHRKFLNNLKSQLSNGLAPDCFGKTLLQVSQPSLVGKERAKRCHSCKTTKP